ncbi:diguanylate cyclase [Kamptonema sp. UHCC 0994]|uniref:diguanylate cyclase domain-containing protein n=1 Tax=Kamptonema sp. UHCC 0994 TaxID=3031329 RepID=UPI0023B8B4FB|nr:diguanylate cyclase [Kamptonema sp. UHCC 0994]MDF0553325.1 diguanylate cyclase [Kamptonema sp. UHCC 0994]
MLIRQSHSSEPERENLHSPDDCTSVPQIQEFSKVGTPELGWYRILWENLPCICFVIDAKGIIFSVNQFGANRLGYSQVELTSEPIFNIFNSEDRERLQEQFCAFVHQASSDSPPNSALGEGCITCKDGSIMVVKSILHPLPSLTGEELVRERALVIGNCQLPLIILICEVISWQIPEVKISSESLEDCQKHQPETNRQKLTQDYKSNKLAEEALEREEHLFTNGPVTIFRWKPEEKWPVEYVSQNVVQFGYQASDFISKKLFYANIIHPEDLARVMAEVKSYSEAGVKSFEQNYRIVKGDGLSRWVYDFTSVVRNSIGEISYYDGYVLDITESKLAQISLCQQAERERLVGQIQARIRSSLDLEAVLNTAAAEVRQFLETDRVIIFRFRPDWSGDVVVESLNKGTISILNTNIYDPCFGETYVGQYQKGRIRAVEDIYNGGLNQCHINLLSNCHVRSNLVVPIIQTDQKVKKSPSSSVVDWEGKTQNSLWGLLIAHHCQETRQWQSWEMELLKQLATQIAIAIEQSQLYQQLELANQELQNLASLDGLTKIANRRRFDEVLTQEWQRLIVEPIRLSLILCDIDCFKAYNDTYGHQAGDTCLQQVALAIRDTCREIPPERLYLVARYGGEEFAVILPNTDIVDAIAVAEEIRRRIQVLAIPHKKSLVSEYITLSLGVASADAAQGLPETLIAAADQALYKAKFQGRDRVVAKE